MCTPKAALRRRLLEARAAAPAAEREQTDVAIRRLVLADEAFRAAHTVFLYVSVGEEIDTRGLLTAALADGKTVCVPRCEARGVMTARQIASLDELLPARFGLLEPAESAPVITPAAIAFAVVPALACDRMGYRLGYGGGYYDRFLVQTQATKAALCAESRLLDTLPHEPHDARINMIFTERQVLRLYEK